MTSLLQRSNNELRKRVRRYIAHPLLQQPFRLLYRVALAGMNYGGAGSSFSAGDELALERLARMPGEAGAKVIFDVGANVGGYVKQALRIVGADATVHAFEPSSAAFSRLSGLFGAEPNVHLVKAGIGGAPGTTTLWSPLPGSVLATTFANSIEGDLQGERIDILTLDQYCQDHSIRRIHLLKLDLEGGEVEALRGSTRLLADGAIDLIQFEFGEPSLGARTFFADVFGLLANKFQIYRVLPRGLQRIDAYHETLEVFMSTNYLAVSRSLGR